MPYAGVFKTQSCTISILPKDNSGILKAISNLKEEMFGELYKVSRDMRDYFRTNNFSIQSNVNYRLNNIRSFNEN